MSLEKEGRGSEGRRRRGASESQRMEGRVNARDDGGTQGKKVVAGF